ncbi:hypothetical protein [Novosphingobium profundi]|uniref:hypothetical protein n=1 Tax=Novosphingobium profundi TaxID=1774954 RepID=UPI0031BB82CC
MTLPSTCGRAQGSTAKTPAAGHAPPPSSAPVAIRGGGVGAHCCRGLLAQAGLAARLELPAPSQAPAILLGAGAVHLLRECLEAPHLLEGTRRVRRRIVAWGGAEPSVLPHEALVLSGGELHAALLAAHEAQGRPPRAMPGAYSVHAAAPFPEPTLLHFGQRRAQALRVELRHDDDADACWIEAVENGWLFLIPAGAKAGWLLAVGGPLKELLTSSRHIGPRITPQDNEPSRFETAPRMLERMAGPGWLACGTEAIAFDPLCGDGTAQAAREASLASAVLTAIARTDGSAGAAQPYLDHYQSMLLAAMRRHLRQCAQFYATGGQSPWWREQLLSTQHAFAQCTARLATWPEPRYRLDGLTLAPIEAAA